MEIQSNKKDRLSFKVQIGQETYSLFIDSESKLSDLYDQVAKATQSDRFSFKLIFNNQTIIDDPDMTLFRFYLGKQQDNIFIEYQRIINNGFYFRIRKQHEDRIYQISLEGEKTLQELFNFIQKKVGVDQDKLDIMFDNQIIPHDYNLKLNEFFFNQKEIKEIVIISFIFNMKILGLGKGFDLQFSIKDNLSQLYDSFKKQISFEIYQFTLFYKNSKIPNDPNILLVEYFNINDAIYEIQCLKSKNQNQNEYFFIVRFNQTGDRYEFKLKYDYKVSDLFDCIMEITQLDKYSQRLCLVYDNQRIIDDINVELKNRFGFIEETKEISCYFENI